MESGVATLRPAVAVPEEARQRIEGAGLELAAEDVHARSLRRPAGDEPATAPKADRHEAEPDEDEEDERRPHPADAPVTRERGEEDGRAHAEGGDHRAGQERPVARADEDPVEREDRAVQRLHEREQRPQERDLVERVLRRS